MMQMNNKKAVRQVTPKDKSVGQLKKIYQEATKNTLPTMKRGGK